MKVKNAVSGGGPLSTAVRSCERFYNVTPYQVPHCCRRTNTGVCSKKQAMVKTSYGGTRLAQPNGPRHSVWAQGCARRDMVNIVGYSPILIWSKLLSVDLVNNVMSP